MLQMICSVSCLINGAKCPQCMTKYSGSQMYAQFFHFWAWGSYGIINDWLLLGTDKQPLSLFSHWTSQQLKEDHPGEWIPAFIAMSCVNLSFQNVTPTGTYLAVSKWKQHLHAPPSVDDKDEYSEDRRSLIFYRQGCFFCLPLPSSCWLFYRIHCQK